MSQIARQQRVLIVEDEVYVRITTAAAIADAGMSFYEAGDVDEALAAMEAFPDIDVLFTDIDMPGELDGLALAAKVSVRWPHVRIIVTSGAANANVADLPQTSIFLAKPYRMSDLMTSLNDIAYHRAVV